VRIISSKKNKELLMNRIQCMRDTAAVLNSNIEELAWKREECVNPPMIVTRDESSSSESSSSES
jgi:hypothetical protein